MLAVAMAVGFAPASLGQTADGAHDETAAATASQSGLRWKFDVVSIRRDTAGGPQYIGRPTADGYQMKNMVVGYLILMAYVPQTGGAAAYTGNQILGAPAWLGSDDDRYDVDAKVSPADLADWQNPAKQPAMMRSMLETMLQDRLKLVVHRSTKEAPVYLLEVGKDGPKFKETNPDELHQDARTMPGGGGFLSREEEGGVMTIHYWGITMAQLARFVLGAERPIEDKTGLIGKYDVTVHRPLPAAAQLGDATDAAVDPGPSAAEIAAQLGLRLELAQGQVETLVIDHVERPSDN
jgi:uncharacterized protein (TIGR03435 family)